MRTAVAIAIAGALGALARYGLDGFVTRSTRGAFPVETYRLAEDRATGLAFANIAGSCVAGLAAVYLGIVLARAV